MNTLRSIFVHLEDKTSKDKNCVVIYEIICNQDPAHVYMGETKRALGKRFKEHTNLTIPTGVGDHCNASGHSLSLNNTKVLTTMDQTKSEGSYIHKEKCPINEPRTGRYQLPPIYHQLLLPEQLTRRKTSRDF